MKGSLLLHPEFVSLCWAVFQFLIALSLLTFISLFSLSLAFVFCLFLIDMHQVDPLDGTKEYTLGHLDGVTVLIGISVNGHAVAGVIGQPFTERIVWGAVGLGTFGVQEHAPSSHGTATIAAGEFSASLLSNYPRRGVKIPASRAIVTTRSHFTTLLEQLVSALKPTKLLRSGGAGSKSLMLLSHVADAYYFPSCGLKAWDCVACDACITAAGGKCTDAYGNELVYLANETTKANGYENNRGMLATMKKEDHEYYVLPESVSINNGNS